MIAEFDTQRDKLPGATLAMKLHAEGLKHAEFIDSLQAKLTEDNQAAEKEFQAALEAHEKTVTIWCKCAGCSPSAPDIAETRRQAEQSTLKRHNTCKKLVERHESEWKLRQEARRLEIDTHAARQVRLDLERGFQLRFAECGQSWAVIQKRQAEEVEALEKNRDLAFAAVQERHKFADSMLYEDHCRVEKWWQYLCKENVAARERIDEGEKRALAELGHDETGETVASAEMTQAAKMITRAVAHCDEGAGELKTVRLLPPSEEGAAATCHTPDKDINIILPIIILPASACDTNEPASSSLSSDSRGLLSQPSVLSANMAHLSDESSLVSVVSANFNPLYDPAADGVLRPGSERYATLANPFAHAERQTVVVSQLAHLEPVGCIPDRSSSPDSGGSDSEFVEI